MADKGIPLRFLTEVGTRTSLRIYWGDDCPKRYGYHNAQVHLVDSDQLEDWKSGGVVEDHPIECWPTKCDGCGAAAPSFHETKPCGYKECTDPDCSRPVVTRQVFHARLYSAPDGALVSDKNGEFKPGDAFIATWCGVESNGGCHTWTNCDGKHLNVVCPDGDQWDVNSRARNCTMREDATHRCWVLHGDASKGEPVTVDKSGRTCDAGAGSIQTSKWHGFLRAGRLVVS